MVMESTANVLWTTHTRGLEDTLFKDTSTLQHSSDLWFLTETLLLSPLGCNTNQNLSSLSPYLIPKGYVTLDGASLTLIEVSPATGGPIPSNSTAGEVREDVQTPKKEIVEFSVMLIAHTQEVIGLSRKKPGDTVNVELDMVGKYVHRAVLGSLERDAEEHAESSNSVDAGREVVGTATGPASSEALEGMVERIVRKVLSEQK